MNFTPQQQHSLLSKMGYNGPVDSNMMDAFLSSNPGAAAKMGKFDRVMKRGFSAGGSVDNRVRQAYRNIFGRDPKAEGFEYWKNVVQNNPNFDLEAEFRKSPEYQARSVYQELLGRQPGMGAIENFINSGTTADQLRTQILASPEYQAKQNQTTGGTPPVTTPPVTTPPVTTPPVTTPPVTTPPVTTPPVTTPPVTTPPVTTPPVTTPPVTTPPVTTPTGGSVDDRVRQAYRDTFGRDPKTEGFEFWKNALIQNPNLDLEAEFRKSPEYEARSVYEELLGRQPQIETVENFINTGTTADQLRTQILASPEYQVRQAYESVFGKTPDEEGLQYWMDAFSQNPNLDLQAELRDSEEYRALGVDELEERRDRYTATRSPLDLSKLQEGLPSTVELAATALVDPMSRVTQATPPQMTVEEDQLVDPSAGVPTAPVGQAETTTVGTTSQAAAPEALTAAQMTAQTVSPAVKGEMDKLQPVQGTVSDKAQVTAQTFNPESLSQLGLTVPQIEEAQKIANIPDLSLTQDQLAKAATLASTGLSLPQAVAQTTGEDFTAIAAKFSGKTPEAIAQDQYNLTPTQAAKIQKTEVQEAAKASEIPTAQEAQSNFQSDIQAAKGTVGVNELVKAKDIIGTEKAITAIAATSEKLNEAAIANAAQGTLSQASLAQAIQGNVTAESTVQGQMASLMKQFDDGTPAWAAGAMRAANAAMSARGLGGSSMASAAIVQAAMESAIPIASQDAQTFAQMNLSNLDRKQQVALANAAASQNMELANLNNRQQAALQNSSNAFALQSQNLSNSQQVVISNAQFKASLQSQTLDIKTQTALANAAKYAEINKINLNNEQQTRLQNSAQNLQVDMANLSNRQQTALSNLQVRAALIGQELSNEQQMAVLQSTQEFEAASIDANNQQQAFMQDAAAQAALEGRALDARQQTALFNVSSQLREREIELTNEQQTRLFNTTNAMNIELANLSNKQQTALANAQIEAAIVGQELSNTQQVNVVNAARISEIANINFNAEQQKAIENARLAQTVDIENLGISQAKLIADASAMANMDMANLNNRQQAAVQNAKAFLEMDMANLNNQQQTAIFKSQQIVNSMLSDQAAENAAAQFNAASENQTNQFFADLQSTVSRFNADQMNGVAKFNAGEENATARFNESLAEQRQQFETSNRLIVAQANAKWRQDIATANTAMENEALMESVKAANSMTTTAIDNMWQRERDLMDFAYRSSESVMDRNLSILLADKDMELFRERLDAQADMARGAAFGDLFSDGLEILLGL